MPNISILIPAFNVANYIATTIESVIKQTYQDWELLILDDCSTDNTYEIALTWTLKDARIKVIRNEINLGMLQNWNKGISLCHAPFFVKLDADDIWHESMLDKALNVLNQYPQVGLVFSKYINIDTQGNIILNSDVALPDFARNKPFNCIRLVKEGPHQMLAYPILRQGLSVMRRRIFDEIGLYKSLLSEETQASTDTELYFRVGAHYDIFCIDEVLYFYRIHNQSISALDTKNNLNSRKIFEIKFCIIKYYGEKNILSVAEEEDYLKRINLEYNFINISHYRQGKEWGKAIELFCKQLYHYPFKTFKFYFKRILS